MNLKKYVIILIVAAGLFGCKKYLDKGPLDSVNTSNFWLTADDAVSAINGAYQPLQWPKLYNLRMWTTDIWGGKQ